MKYGAFMFDIVEKYVLFVGCVHLVDQLDKVVKVVDEVNELWESLLPCDLLRFYLCIF